MGRPRGGGSSYGLRRQSGGRRGQNASSMKNSTGVELLMECMDDALSPSQVEATKRAKEEYTKAVKMIEAAKAEAARATAEALRLASFPPAKSSIADSPDIMIVGETPAPVSGHAQMPRPPVGSPVRGMVPTTVAVPASGMMEGPGAAVPQQGFHIVTKAVPASGMMTGQGAVPQQVYRFVSLNQHNNTTTNNNAQQNQWFLRPIMPVMPQQQPHARSPLSSSIRQPGMGGSPMSGPTIVSGTSGLGIKRPMNEAAGYQMPAVSNKRARGRASTESENGGGSWVPLDEYYYGKMEGDPTYTEEKAEFRFKCWMCTKMLYNNVKAMMHLQGHIDSEKQQNLDLSDLTQCKYCYKQFDTPFEMQTHIEKIHMNNINVLMCRICEKDHESRNALTTHMRQNHCACEMPYMCQLCNFRSSMYSDVVDHFKKKHDSSDNMLCLYCLRVFHIKFVAQGWGQTQTYYHHLLRHQTKTGNKKCSLCKLSFFNTQDMKQHRKTSHQPNQRGVMGVSAKCSMPDQVMIKVPETGIMHKKSSGPKSLNAPTISKVTEHRGLRLPAETVTSYCTECHTLMNTSDHYKKYIQCSMCRFATSCSFAYATHMMGFHSGQLSALSASVPAERSMAAPLYCLCGFSSKFGNRVATHLVACSKRTCYLHKPELPPADKLGQDDQVDPRRKPDASILDALGLVKKQVINPAAEDGEEIAAAATSQNIPDWVNQAESQGDDALEESSASQEHKPEVPEADEQGEPMQVSTGEDSAQQAAKEEPDADVSPRQQQQPLEENADNSGAGVEAQDSFQDGTGVAEESKDWDNSERISDDSGFKQDTEGEVGEAAGDTRPEGENISEAVSETGAEGEALSETHTEAAEVNQAAEEEEPQADTSAAAMEQEEEVIKEAEDEPEQGIETVAQPELTQDNEENIDEVPQAQSPAVEAEACDAPMEVDRELEEGASLDEQRAAEGENEESSRQGADALGQEAMEESAGDVAQGEDEAPAHVDREDEEPWQPNVEEPQEMTHSVEESAEPVPEENEELLAEQEEEDRSSEQRQAPPEESAMEADWEPSASSLPEESTTGGLPPPDDEGSMAVEEGEGEESVHDADDRVSTDTENVDKEAEDGDDADKEAAEDRDYADKVAEGDKDSDENAEGQDFADRDADKQGNRDSMDKGAEGDEQSTAKGEEGAGDSGDKEREGDRDVVPESLQPEQVSVDKPATALEEQGPQQAHQPEDSERPAEEASGISSGGGSDLGPAVVGDSKPAGEADLPQGSSKPEESQESSKGGRETWPEDNSNSKELEKSSAVSGHSQPYSGNSSSSSSSKDRNFSRDRPHDRQRDHSGSYSDYRDRDRDRDYRRDRDRYDRDRDYHDRHRHHDRYRDQRYDSHHGRYQQGHGSRDRDRYYDQDRHGNRGGQNRHGYQDRNYHRGYN